MIAAATQGWILIVAPHASQDPGHVPLDEQEGLAARAAAAEVREAATRQQLAAAAAGAQEVREELMGELEEAREALHREKGERARMVASLRHVVGSLQQVCSSRRAACVQYAALCVCGCATVRSTPVCCTGVKRKGTLATPAWPLCLGLCVWSWHSALILL